jgi:hypothetical protein
MRRSFRKARDTVAWEMPSLAASSRIVQRVATDFMQRVHVISFDTQPQ